jgi:hypothetical protein
MVALRSSAVKRYLTTRRHILEDRTIYSHPLEDLKFKTIYMFLVI